METFVHQAQKTLLSWVRPPSSSAGVSSRFHEPLMSCSCPTPAKLELRTFPLLVPSYLLMQILSWLFCMCLCQVSGY